MCSTHPPILHGEVPPNKSWCFPLVHLMCIYVLLQWIWWISFAWMRVFGLCRHVTICRWNNSLISSYVAWAFMYARCCSYQALYFLFTRISFCFLFALQRENISWQTQISNTRPYHWHIFFLYSSHAVLVWYEGTSK